MQEKTKAKIWKTAAVVIWSVFLVVFVGSMYVSWYMPHGPKVSTGDYECEYDGRGPCEEGYFEDLRNVDIPEWAKFLRSEYEALLLTLLILGIVASGRPSGGYKSPS